MYGQYVRIRFAETKQEYLQLCEVQVLAPTLKDTDLAYMAGKPQQLTELSGMIGPLTMYNVGRYSPNTICEWRITIPIDKVRHFKFVLSNYMLKDCKVADLCFQIVIPCLGLRSACLNRLHHECLRSRCALCRFGSIVNLS